MRIAPRLAPINAAVFPLVNKDGMPEIAEKIHGELAKNSPKWASSRRTPRPTSASAMRGARGGIGPDGAMEGVRILARGWRRGSSAQREVVRQSRRCAPRVSVGCEIARHGRRVVIGFAPGTQELGDAFTNRDFVRSFCVSPNDLSRVQQRAGRRAQSRLVTAAVQARPPAVRSRRRVAQATRSAPCRKRQSRILPAKRRT